MARIRNIKPEFAFDFDMAHLDPWYQLFFILLWTHSDKAGRGKDEPEVLKAKIQPWGPKSGEDCMSALTPRWVCRYTGTDGKKYFQVRNWHHQRPHKMEPDSEIPPPTSENLKDGFNTVSKPYQDVAKTLETLSGNGDGDGDGNGEYCAEALKKQALAATVRGIEMRFPTVGRPNQPKEWVLTDAKVKEYKESYPGVDVEIVLMQARQWCIDNPTKRKTFNGMAAFLSRWLSKEQNNHSFKSDGHKTQSLAKQKDWTAL